MFSYYITTHFIPSNKDYNSYRNPHSVYQTYPYSHKKIETFYNGQDCHLILNSYRTTHFFTIFCHNSDMTDCEWLSITYTWTHHFLFLHINEGFIEIKDNKHNRVHTTNWESSNLQNRFTKQTKTQQANQTQI